MSQEKKFGHVVKTGDGSLTIRLGDIDECFHSTSGARSEAESLYIVASALPNYLSATPMGAPAVVLDIGLGLGYNACATMDCWHRMHTQVDMKILSLEKDENLVAALASGCAPWQENWGGEWLSYGKGLRQVDKMVWTANLTHPQTNAHLEWVVRIGNAAVDELINPFPQKFNFVWQDPFSPAKNPEMWSASWFEKILVECDLGCSLLTYSCSRTVKDSLTRAGWSWKKIKGSGRKRDWLRASPTSIEEKCHPGAKPLGGQY